jgi:hypothetical protein
MVKSPVFLLWVTYIMLQCKRNKFAKVLLGMLSEKMSMTLTVEFERCMRLSLNFSTTMDKEELEVLRYTDFQYYLKKVNDIDFKTN